MGLQMGSQIVLGRILLPTDFGLVAMVVSITGLAEVLRDMGLTLAAIQTDKITQQQKSNLFWINATLGIGLTGLLSALAYPIAALYGEDRLVSITLVVAWVYTINALAAQFRAEINRNLRFQLLGLVDVVPLVVGLVVAITIALTTHSYWALVWQQVAVALTGFVMLVGFARWWPSLPKTGANMRGLVRFGLGTAGTQIVGYLTRNADNVAIGAVWGAEPLGFYSKGYQLLLMPINQLVSPLTRVVLPVFSRVSSDALRLSEYIRVASTTLCIGLSVLFGVAAGVAEPVVVWLLGERWLPMVPLFQAMALGGLFSALTQVSQWVYMGMGQTGKLLRLNLISRPLTVVILMLGLPWGAMGVAVASSVAFFVGWVVSLIGCRRDLGIDDSWLIWQGVRLPLLVGVPLALICLGVTQLISTLWIALVLAALAAVTYLGLLALLPPFSADRRYMTLGVRAMFNR
jgi:PST family polysaccharide transporter